MWIALGDTIIQPTIETHEVLYPNLYKLLDGLRNLI